VGNKNGGPTVALLLLALAAPLAVAAGKNLPSAEGNVRLPADGSESAIEFSASADADGTAFGWMQLTDPGGSPVQDVDGVGIDLRGLPPGHFFKAELDCLEVVRNKAVMSGVITDSAQADYVGRRVILVAVDNGEGGRDKLTWGVYQREEGTWLASDAEAENDPGVGMTWVATDAEREDDVGEPSRRGEPTTCKNLPLSSFSLIELKKDEGDIRVRP
jgi:hypothetical protein